MEETSIPDTGASAADRTRTIAWQGPMIGAVAARTMSGLEYLQAIVAGQLPPPPIAVLMGIRLIEIEEGRAVFAVEPAEYHCYTEA